MRSPYRPSHLTLVNGSRQPFNPIDQDDRDAIVIVGGQVRLGVDITRVECEGQLGLDVPDGLGGFFARGAVASGQQGHGYHGR